MTPPRTSDLQTPKLQKIPLLSLLLSFFAVVTHCSVFLEPCEFSSCGKTLEANYCFCDSLCSMYGDCCHDADVPTKPPFNPRFSCTKLTRRMPSRHWTVTTCSKSWIAEQETDGIASSFIQGTVDACEKPSANGVFKFIPPVTDKTTGFLYRNQYCAFCNGVQQSSIVGWRVQLRCEAPPRITVPPVTIIISKPATEALATLPPPPPEDDGSRTARSTLQSNYSVNELLEKCSVEEFRKPNSIPTQRTCAFLPSGLISLCPETGTPSDLDYNCTHSGFNIVAFGRSTYKNGYCAACWNASMGNVSGVCTLLLREFITAKDTDSFILLFDISGTSAAGSTATSLTSGYSIVQETCPSGSVYDVFRAACRELPSANCTADSNSTRITLEGGSYNVVSNDTVYWINFAYNVSFSSLSINGRPLVCIPEVDTTVCVPILLENDEYILGNESGRNDLMWNNGTYQIEGYDVNGRPLICTNLTGGISPVFTYPLAFDILTYIGLCIDLVSCCLILLTFILFKDLRKFFSRLLINFVISIILGDLVFLFGGPLFTLIQVQGFCVAVGIVLHYVFLLRFSWMTIMGFELVRSFFNIKNLNKKATETWKLTFMYMLVAWLIPLIIVVTTIAVNFTVEDSVDYGVVGGSCWINQRIALIVSFITPVGLSIALNMVAFIAVVVMLLRIRRRSTVGSVDLTECRKQSLKDLRFAVTLFILTGLTWLFGFLALSSPHLSWAWYPFIIFNTTQALAVLVFLLFTKKVLRLYRSLLCCSGKGQASISSTATTKQTKSEPVSAFKHELSTSTVGGSISEEKSAISDTL